MAIGIANGIGFGKKFNFEAYWTTHLRNHQVGVISVTPESYDTNSSATTITVGASGADYDTLAAAVTAASAGNVIEIIDDAITMAGAVSWNKGVDGSGKAIKIKGKSTKSTVTLANAAYALQLAGANASMEFENIIFVEPNQNNPIFLNSITTGFAHFINCTFNTKGGILISDVLSTVFDGCSFTGISYLYTLYISISNSSPTLAKININNCTTTSVTSRNFLNFNKLGTKTFDHVSVTNSTLAVARTTLQLTNQVVNSVNIKGNRIDDLAGYPAIYIGAEAAVLDIVGYDPYNAGTNYVTGNFCDNLGILWECVTNCVGSEPTKSNANWRPARFTTGTIENNTITRAVYAASGHGVFLGYGCYNMSIKYNIVSNHWYNIVIKGHNNTIQYNCSGKGFNGISVFANDQLLVSNNTVREAGGTSLFWGPQAANGVGLINTNFKDNILSSGNQTINDFHERWNPYSGVLNVFNQNIYHCTLNNQNARFEGVAYNTIVPAEFATMIGEMGDSKAQSIAITWADDVDDLNEGYYTPTNAELPYLKDAYGQSVGAVDLYALQ